MQLITEIIDATRLRNSVNGAPRWRLTTTHDGYCRYTTQPDSQCAYGADKWVGKRVRLDMTPSGLIWNITELQ